MADVIAGHTPVFVVFMGDGIHPAQQFRFEIETGSLVTSTLTGELADACEEIACPTRFHVRAGTHPTHRNTDPHLLNRRYHRSVMIQYRVEYRRHVGAIRQAVIQAVVFELTPDLVVGQVEAKLMAIARFPFVLPGG